MSFAFISLKIPTQNYKEDKKMKLIGNKDKGYKLVSSFEEKENKPHKPKGSAPDPKSDTPDATNNGKDDK